jgi:hypothetical protein
MDDVCCSSTTHGNRLHMVVIPSLTTHVTFEELCEAAIDAMKIPRKKAALVKIAC